MLLGMIYFEFYREIKANSMQAVFNDLRQYTPVEFDTKSPNMAIDQIYRQMKVFGCLSKNTDDEVGICDVLDSNGDVIHQFGLTNYGINWLYKKYDLRVVT